MIQSTEQEILTYIKIRSANLSQFLPASLSFTNKIRSYKKHLDNIVNYYFMSEPIYNLNKSYWKSDVGNFLSTLYLPQFEWYFELEKLYENRTNSKIIRRIEGEKSDYVEEKQEECHICISSFSSEDTHLSCGHWVCKKCVIKSGNEHCPICRKVVSLEVQEVEKLYKAKEKMKLEREREERYQLLLQQTNTLENMLFEYTELFNNTTSLEYLTKMIYVCDLMNEHLQVMPQIYHHARRIISIFI